MDEIDARSSLRRLPENELRAIGGCKVGQSADQALPVIKARPHLEITTQIRCPSVDQKEESVLIILSRIGCVVAPGIQLCTELDRAARQETGEAHFEVRAAGSAVNSVHRIN